MTLTLLLPLLALANAIAIAVAVHAAPYPAFAPLGSPAAYLNIYIHVPAAIVSYLAYGVAMASAICFLVKRSIVCDRASFAGVAVGSIYAAYTLVSGSIWAAESWGTPWNWDPRETGVLLLFIVYLAYFALRASIADPEKAASVSAVYAIAAFAMVPVSYLAPRIAESSLHPTQAFLQSFMQDPTVKVYFYTRLVLEATLAITAIYFVAKGARIGRRGLAVAGLAVAVLAIAASSLAVEYAGGVVTRAYVVFPSEEGYTVTVWLDDGLANVSVRKLYAPMVNGTPAVAGHLVKLVGLQGHSAEALEVLRPPAVIANVVLYALLIVGLVFVVVRGGRGGGSA